MSQSPLFLLLEDNEQDASLIAVELERAKIECRLLRVETREEFEAAFDQNPIDLVLADFSIVGFGGDEALQWTRERHPGIPFILVSGVIGEELAVDMLKQGATDYVLKQRIYRLGTAVQRALGESKRRVETDRHARMLRLLHTVVEQTGEGIVITDAKLDQPGPGIIFVNPAFTRLTGYEPFEVLGKTPRMLQGPKTSRAVLDRLRQNLTSGVEFQGETINYRKDGSEFWLRWRIYPLRNEGGEITHFVAFQSDVTAEKNARKALIASEERYRAFFEEDLTGNFIAAADGSILDCNRAFARIFGFVSIDHALRTNLFSLSPDADARAKLCRTLQHSKLEHYESELRTVDGDPLFVIENLIGMLDPEGNLVQIKGYVFDNTQRKILEQQLTQAQKLESLGRLASGIAHDFNNILSIILGYGSLLENYKDRPEKIQESAHAITTAVARGSNLVRQLLTFARKRETTMQPIHVNTVLKELSQLLVSTFPRSIEFDLNLDATTPEIRADASQLHQIFLNLCVNARDAMPSGGKLTLATNGITGEVVRRKISQAMEDMYVAVRISDQGCGMDEATKKRIFEPFYTTKGESGTGLGLAVVYGAVTAHGGFIDLESQLGIGTTFTIYFPALPAESKVSERNKTAPLPQVSCPRTASILLIEDESSIIDFARAILESKGYSVFPAVTGNEALEKFTEHRDKIDLVISDLGLPGVGGWEVIRRIREIRPEIKIIVATGSSEEEIAGRIKSEKLTGMISKPYQPSQLVAMVERALANPGAISS